jgi:hypothetical protein
LVSGLDWRSKQVRRISRRRAVAAIDLAARAKGDAVFEDLGRIEDALGLDCFDD